MKEGEKEGREGEMGGRGREVEKEVGRRGIGRVCVTGKGTEGRRGRTKKPKREGDCRYIYIAEI